MELSLADAARILGIPEHTLYWRARRGEVPAHLVGERYRFNQVELLEWATQHQVATSTQAPPPSPPESLHAALLRGGIHRDLPGAERAAALRELIRRLPLIDEAAREILIELVLSREGLGTTAVGGEIALPHPRQPIVLGRGEPVAALGLLQQAVDFDAPDGKPVKALLLLICPTARLHLALLRQAARAFGDSSLRASVLAAAPDLKILERLFAIEGGGESGSTATRHAAS